MKWNWETRNLARLFRVKIDRLITKPKKAIIKNFRNVINLHQNKWTSFPRIYLKKRLGTWISSSVDPIYRDKRQHTVDYFLEVIKVMTVNTAKIGDEIISSNFLVWNHKYYRQRIKITLRLRTNEELEETAQKIIVFILIPGVKTNFH